MSKKTKNKIGIGIARTNFKQLLMSKNFYIAIGINVAAILLAFLQKGSDGGHHFQFMNLIGPNESIANTMWTILYFPFVYNLIILASALPATSFCADWNSKYVRSIVSRTGTAKYARHKVLNCYISSFLTVFIAMAIFTLFLFCTGTPMMSENFTGGFAVPINPSYVAPKILEVFMKSHPYLYHLFHMVCFSSYTALWSVTGLAVSAYIPNSYIVYAMPFSAFYIFERKIYDNMKINAFTKWLNIPDFGHCITGSELTGNPILDFIYIILLFLVISLLIGEIFVYGVKRRMRDEMV